MSYILEALQKSERKRQKDTVPDLQSVHVPAAVKKDRRPLWPWLLTAVLLVNGFLLVYYLPSSRDDRVLTGQGLPENRDPAASQQPLVTPSPALTPTAEPLPITSATHAPATTEELLPAAVQTEKPKETKKTTSEIPAPHSPVAAQQSPIVPRSTAEDRTAVVTGGANTSNEIAEHKIPAAENAIASPEDPQPPDNPAAENALHSAHGPASSAEEIPLLSTLPQSFRQRLPELSISFLSYSQKPSKRIVSINGRILREGQTITDDLTIERITSAGVVLDYRGDRFRVEVF